MTAAKPQDADESAAAFTAELPAKVFAAAMARLAVLAPDRATIPIVQHALLKFAGKGALALAATNLDQALAVTVKAKGAGAITASAARLAAIAQLLDEASPVKLKRTETGLTISQGRATWRLPTLPAEDFPTTLVEPLPEAVTWAVPAAAFIALLKEIEGAVSDDDTKPYLCGLFLDLAPRQDPPRPEGTEPTPHAPALVGASIPRLAAVEITGLLPPADAPSLLLPPKALRPLAELAKGRPEILLGLTDSGVTAAVSGGGEDLFFRSKLIEGAQQYPDWRRILPPAEGEGAPPLKARLGLAAFRRAVQQVGVIEGDPVAQGKGKARVTSLKVTFADGEVTISTRNQAGEESEAACPLAWVSVDGVAGDALEAPSEPVTHSVNAAHLAWAVTSIPDANGGEPKEIDIAFSRVLAPLLVTRANDEARQSLRLVMPLRG